MRFFWKVFFTTMFISTLCVSVSGYVLIDSNFRAQLESEVKTAQDYGEIVYHSLANELADRAAYGQPSAGEGAGTAEEAVLQVVQSINISSMDQRIAFGIIGPGGETLFSSLDVALDKSMAASMDTGHAGWTLKEHGSGVYVQVMRPAQYQDSVFYIEMIRDVSHVFSAQRSQYETMLKIMAGMVLIAGVATFTISKFLLRRIAALTEITKTIADGDRSRRAPEHGQDEVALLSKNFNQMADRLEEKIHELQAGVEQRELFVGAFSHELKTPLTSIIGYSDLLRSKELDAGQRRVCADYIFYEGKRLERLSMRLLELIVLKRHDLHPEPVEIERVLTEVVRLLAPQLADAEIQLVYHVEPAVVSMEVELMKTVFINLIDNARKAMDGAGKIIVTGKKGPGGYAVSIQDTGKGMKRQELPRITDAFYMVNKSRSRAQGGSGLGLAICREILALHGFTIAFDSAVGVGTVVTITMEEEGYDVV